MSAMNRADLIDWTTKNGVTVLGWMTAFVSLLCNLRQFRHARRRKVKTVVTCERVFTPGQEHQRALVIDVLNEGTELSNVNVAVTFPREEDGQPFTAYLGRPADVPDPFKFGYPGRWYVINDDPENPFGMWTRVSPKKIVVTVRSEHLPIPGGTLPATKWRKHLKAFARPDPSLPAKPPKLPPSKGPLDYKRW
jgi:hypothetical protein